MEGYFAHVANKLAITRFGPSPQPKLLLFSELKTWALWRAVIAEFLALVLFVFLGCASAIPMNGTPASNEAYVIKISLTFGLGIMVLVQMFGHISGGHINPAVSIAMAVAMKITPVRAILYVIAQTAGGIAGGFLLKGLTPSAYWDNLAVTSVSDQLHPAQGMAIEIILTFVLVFVIFATTDGDRVEYGSASLAIGLTVGLGHLSCIFQTGASMNPARSLGSAVASNAYKDHWVYWVGPIIGGIIAALLYKFVFCPTRGAMSMDDAANKLLGDEDMVVIPKAYFQGKAKIINVKESEKL